MPLYVMDMMSDTPGVPGLFIAGIFSAGLSTISAALNSLAAVTLEDYLKPVYRYTGRDISATKSATIAKLLAFIFGIISIALAFLAQLLGGVLQAGLTIFGIVGGPLLGVFTLGMSTESATENGALIGTITSLIFLFWMAFGQPRPITPILPTTTKGCDMNDLANVTISVLRNVTKIYESTDTNSYFYLYRISYMWYCPLGFLITFALGYIVSNMFRLFNERDDRNDQNKEFDLNLLFPVIARRLRHRRRCGAEIVLTRTRMLNKRQSFNIASCENDVELNNGTKL